MTDDGPAPLSALQHLVYCPRQCALIHLEQDWAENRATAEGRLLHDRAWALSLINRGQVSTRDFQRFETGAVSLSDDARKTVLVAYQERKREELRHPFTGETVAVGLLWHLQARLLAMHLRGDLDAYPPFVVR